jgi:hypothetical protein
MLAGGVLDWMANWLSGSIFAAVTIVGLDVRYVTLGQLNVRLQLSPAALMRGIVRSHQRRGDAQAHAQRTVSDRAL